MRLVHYNGELQDARVGVPHIVEAQDDVHPGRAAKAGVVELQVVKDYTDHDIGV